jgi:hypothetical protein
MTSAGQAVAQQQDQNQTNDNQNQTKTQQYNQSQTQNQDSNQTQGKPFGLWVYLYNVPPDANDVLISIQNSLGNDITYHKVGVDTNVANPNAQTAMWGFDSKE